MAKYDVYGVGNALVDTEFEVPDSFFEEHGIEKGLMTLVSHEEQAHRVNILKESCSVKKQSGGGSAGNTMYALSQFGAKGFYACKVANDETGDFFLEQLGQNNIATNIATREDGTSGKCLIMVSPDAERTMNTYLGISETLSIEDIDFDVVLESEYVYLEGFLVTSATAKAAIKEIKAFAEKHNIKTALTFSDPAVVQYFKDDVNDVLGDGIDLLFCNEQELALWADTDDFEAGCALMQSKAKQFVVTRGPDGAVVFDGEKYISVPGNPVDAIDTNGAGDLFAGSFLYGITQGNDFTTSAKLACLASSKVVTKFGPRLDSAQHAEIKQEIFD